MPMLKDAVKRKTHKERAQPASRRRFGLLEKKKDYKLRADDYHKKEKTILNLRRKAEERNPDEFYFAMEKGRTKDGVHEGRLTESNKYTQEQLQLMRTQDIGYINTKAQTDAKKVDRMKASLHFIGAAPRNKHTVFVDSTQEAQRFRPEEYFDTEPALLGRAFNRPRREQIDSDTLLVGGSGANASRVAKKAEKAKTVAYKELAQRMERVGKLRQAAQGMELAKAVAGNGRKRKLQPHELAEGSAGGKVFKWKKERKK
mmetsp:Transcript_36387/g.91427  ORF Transcript_36387/g.91427 Transcript_36387/m.91427 type:complete len:258 (+) Transcript_36387:122-895(+)